MRKILLVICIISGAYINAYSQYFGQNKPSYKKFDFKVYRTPHFEIYHYLKNDSVLKRLAQLSEQWYNMHQAMFLDTFKTPNPIIFYNDHADFQQTTAISGLVDVGTGGVTEAFKNRVVMPIATSYAQTDHVLGHEMVHAFQFKTLLGDSANYSMLRNIPLWMIEGMAEYFSIGSVDAHTALWMRDAIVNNDFPTLEMMSRSYKYFPYRFGQCFWAMVGRTWGDSLIMPLFKQTAMYGYPFAVRRVLGYDEMTLSSMWKTALVNHYQKYFDVALTTPVGKKILFSKNAGDMNISPSVSPDGKYVVFLSERELFSLDLYLADAHTGQIIRKISSVTHSSEVDAFNFIESSGSWSPDGKHFVFTIYSGGMNQLMVVNVEKGRTVRKYKVPGVPAFSNPAWSPTGNQIVMSGMVEGVNNLYLFDLNTKEVTRLTDGPYAYLQPAWSNDGKYLVFSTDKPTYDGAFIDTKGGTNLAIMELTTKQIQLLNVFPKAKNLNPVFAPDNNSFYFLSNRDGFRNLYEYKLDSGKVYQLTRFFTGITGITEFSPAMSVDRNENLINYTYFYGGKYSVYSANRSEFNAIEVNPDSVNFDAATLPPLERNGSNIVDNQLWNRDSMQLTPVEKFMTSPYRPKFQLDYISNVNVGVATSRFGTGMAGSVLAIWSDIVGQNQLYTMAALNGEIYDFGAQVVYVNSKNKINWGVGISHIPYLYGYYMPAYDSILIHRYRIFEDKLSLFAMRPLSRYRRIEFGTSLAYYYNRYEIEKYKYSYYYGYWYYDSREVIKQPGYWLQTVDAAFVIDNSVFGMTAPVKGGRTRIGIEKYFGEFTFMTYLLDVRQYWYKKPVTFAFRAFHYGRWYGFGSEDSRLNQLYLGYPWYLRGYEYSTFTKDFDPMDTLAVNMNDLFGSKMALLNAELRIPFTGPKKLALIGSGFLFSDLVFFADAGIAWDNSNYPTLRTKKTKPNQRIPLVSMGASLRINVLGYMIIEPYYAFPLQYGGFNNPIFGVNFQPGW